MCGKFHILLQMVRVLVAICPKMAVFGQKQTDRQTNYLTQYTGVGVDFFLKLNLLPLYLLRLQGDKLKFLPIFNIFYLFVT